MISCYRQNKGQGKTEQNNNLNHSETNEVWSVMTDETLIIAKIKLIALYLEGL